MITVPEWRIGRGSLEDKRVSELISEKRRRKLSIFLKERGLSKKKSFSLSQSLGPSRVS